MSTKKGLGHIIAPPRFVAFALIAIVGIAVGITTLGWRQGTMAGFDVAALTFLLSCIPLLDHAPDDIREAARRNDANRVGLLAITGGVTAVILIAVASELMQKGSPKPLDIALIVATLVLAWSFSNMIYALHYTHMFYVEHKGDDCGGLEFPKTKEPNYWDFVYFAFCLGMTFQTSDTSITTTHFRIIVTLHCLAAFVFNLGVLAFTINVLGGGG